MTTGDMDRPSEGDRPGAVDDAVWTELVASFHASTADRPGLWPESENLPGDPDGPDPHGPAGSAAAATGPGAPGIGAPAPGRDGVLPADPGAGLLPGAGAALGAAPGSSSPATPARVVRPAHRAGQEPPPVAPPAAVTWTGGPRDYAPAEPVDEDGYVPPPPPPLPELGMATKAAWLAGLGGPGYLALATILQWNTPQWTLLLCVLSGVVGFGYLVSKLKDRPEDGDDPDDPTYGAVL